MHYKFLFLFLTLCHCQNRNYLDDICGPINQKRIYLDYAEKGSLQSKTNQMAKCSVELISCPSCIIHIEFKFLNLSCDTSHVWIYEPNFEQSSQKFCGLMSTNLDFLSHTRTVMVEFWAQDQHKFAFRLDYRSERNRISLKGAPNSGETHFITTPFFPNFYPTDLTMEYVIKCTIKNETCRILLIFTDFLIAPSTIIDFFDFNNERIYVTTGNVFRPPVILTSGPFLLIRFYANGATDFGFKAFYSFILGRTSARLLKPNTNCGGHVTNLGGAITMMNMVQTLNYYDCLWLIKPPDFEKSELYVKLVNFSGFGAGTELTIHKGLTSMGLVAQNVETKEHTVPVSQGFYVHLKAVFRRDSRFALIYAVFNSDCSFPSDFRCKNQRCISMLLNCDGFDHCGDNSDEEICFRDRKEWSKVPHFLFTTDSGLTEIATSTLIFLLGSFGLIALILAIVVFLYRVSLKTRQQMQLQGHIETINAILDEGMRVVEEEIIISDEPPLYEPPPTYEDVVGRKIGRGCQTVVTIVPNSPPPAYACGKQIRVWNFEKKSCSDSEIYSRNKKMARILKKSSLQNLVL